MKSSISSILLKTLVTIAVLSAVLFQSCKLDKCKAIVCAYGGICNEGSCTCLPGYEGANCETITRNKFISSIWEVSEKGTISPKRKYGVAIEPAAEVNWVTLNNFYNFFGSRSVRAYVERDTIIIPNQQINGKVIVGRGYIMSASPELVNNIIVLRYLIVDSANNNIVDDFGYNAALNNSSPSVWTI
jgi:hypothetical protein